MFKVLYNRKRMTRWVMLSTCSFGEHILSLNKGMVVNIKLHSFKKEAEIPRRSNRADHKKNFWLKILFSLLKKTGRDGYAPD